MKRYALGRVSFPFTLPLCWAYGASISHGDPPQVFSSVVSPKNSKLPADRESSLSWLRPDGLTKGVSMPIQMGSSSASGGLDRSLSRETFQASSFGSSDLVDAAGPKHPRRLASSGDTLEGHSVSCADCRAIIGT